MKALVAALWLALLAGCAGTPQGTRLVSTPPGGLSPHAELSTTPFFAQERYQCGPAALATVLTAAGLPATPDELVAQVYLPDRQGSLAPELAAAARGRGALPYPLEGNLDALLAEIDAGHPVLVLQNLGLAWLPRWHYAVAVGYDLERGTLLLRSGTRARHEVALTTFERTWRRADHWALVVLPPDRLPATARPLPYLAAAEPFEQLGRDTLAAAAYRTAAERWPEAPEARLGLGNLHYRRGDPQAAAREYRTLLGRHPDYAPALNNLAQALADMGRFTAALPYAERAVRLGGPLEPSYRRTLDVIGAAATDPTAEFAD